jgi:hypothetical protein
MEKALAADGGRYTRHGETNIVAGVVLADGLERPSLQRKRSMKTHAQRRQMEGTERGPIKIGPYNQENQH